MSARRLRQEGSRAERVAWACLRNRRLFGLKFRRQQPIGPFFADFYCAELHLVLEIDGASHDAPDRRAYDEARDPWMVDRGLLIIRIRPSDISEAGLRAVVGAALDQAS